MFPFLTKIIDNVKPKGKIIESACVTNNLQNDQFCVSLLEMYNVQSYIKLSAILLSL